MCSTGVLLHRGEGDTVILTELICSCQENGEGQTVLSLIIKTFPASEVTLRKHVSNFPPSQAGVNNLTATALHREVSSAEDLRKDQGFGVPRLMKGGISYQRAPNNSPCCN